MTEDKDLIKEETDFEDDLGEIELTFEDGTKQTFDVIAELPFDDKWYIYFQVKEDDPNYDAEEIEVAELAEDEDGNEVVVPVEDEKLVEKLISELNKIISEQEDK